ncbi:hypothetical protein PVAND_005153 [Polypedilum vanderplanki]|uniref:EGF-like domain-containing protein n=1 Tax=Polypedilum vanderplanki TaxID=319348 RepID=A0A9J6BZZ2_POLVA|nr:hypothetical protein PVAND_005153 [Polypedilum vanderplanki]
MEIFSIFWTFIIAITGISSSHALEFGMCEVQVPQLVVTNLSTPYWVTKTITGCCKGFIKLENDTCQADCRRVNCVNSFCIGNNTCQCNEGYYPIDSYKCLPKCDPPCGPFAQCIEPNKCACGNDYKKFNATHCEPVCKFTEEEFECINARCFEPNKCRCHDGYYPISEFQCEPYCDPQCINGECIAPNQCECHEGFEKNSDGSCVPACHPNCINADCIQPNVCRCHANFEKYLRPNECLKRHVIKDRQDCMRICRNGSCSNNGTCICNYGYEMYSGKCSKICNKKCTNGKCLENQCVCPNDYRLSSDNSTCLPVCAFEDGHDCINGVCIAPNTCKCYPGYRFLNNQNCTCVPMCDPQCINAICTENGCKCHEGFYNISSYECIKNCSVGYTWVYDECMPEQDLDFEEIETTTEEIIKTTRQVDDEMTENLIITTESLITTTESFLTFDKEFEHITVEKNEKDDIPLTTIIVVLSAIIFLLICILITFYILYRHIFPKQIYFVQQKEQSANCVYFTKQPDRKAPLPVTEFNI